MIFLNDIELVDEICEAVPNYIRVGYCQKINRYLLCVGIPSGIVDIIGWRYFLISSEDVSLLKEDKDAFKLRFHCALRQCNQDTDLFIGGAYDYSIGWHFGVDGKYEPVRNGMSYVFWQELLWRRFDWNGEIVLVPPDRRSYINGKLVEFPLRSLPGVRFYKFVGENQFAQFSCYGIPETEALAMEEKHD